MRAATRPRGAARTARRASRAFAPTRRDERNLELIDYKIDSTAKGWPHDEATQTRTLTSRMGLGCMGMSAFYGTTDEGEALATIDRALELGCNFLDTAEMYGPYKNEELRRQGDRGPPRRLRDRDQVRHPLRAHEGEPDQPRAGRLGRERAQLDRGLAEAARARTTSTSGTCTASTSTGPSRRRSARWASWSRRARCATSASARPRPRRCAAHTPMHPITALQTEYSLWTRDVEAEILPDLP